MKKLFALILAASMLTISLCSCGNTEDKKTDTENESKQVEATANEATDNTSSITETDALIFTLTAGVTNEYGSNITINKGTESEITRYVYRIPKGTYVVTNKGKYMGQVNVYSDEIHITEEGLEEWTVGTVKLLDVDQSETITVEANQFVYIAEPDVFEFVKK